LSATANCRESVAEIHFRYQSVIKGAQVAVKVAANLSAFTMLVTVRCCVYAARLPSRQIRSGDVSSQIGNRIFAAEMKEYDA
jgi:hypothetical protein